jgi:Ribonuclease G/E
VRRVAVADNESADKDHASKQRAKVSPLGDVRIMRTRQRWRWRSVASVTHVYL